jgi:hypothetical protein
MHKKSIARQKRKQNFFWSCKKISVVQNLIRALTLQRLSNKLIYNSIIIGFSDEAIMIGRKYYKFCFFLLCMCSNIVVK